MKFRVIYKPHPETGILYYFPEHKFFLLPWFTERSFYGDLIYYDTEQDAIDYIEREKNKIERQFALQIQERELQWKQKQERKVNLKLNKDKTKVCYRDTL